MIVTKITYGETVQTRPYESERLDVEVLPSNGQSYEAAVDECRAFIRHKLRGEPLPAAAAPAKSVPATAPSAASPVIAATATGVTSVTTTTPLVDVTTTDAPADLPETVQRLPKGYGQFTAQQWTDWLSANRVDPAKLEKALQAAVDNKPKAPEVWEVCLKTFADRLREFPETDWPAGVVSMLKAERQYLNQIAAEQAAAA